MHYLDHKNIDATNAIKHPAKNIPSFISFIVFLIINHLPLELYQL